MYNGHLLLQRLIGVLQSDSVASEMPLLSSEPDEHIAALEDHFDPRQTLPSSLYVAARQDYSLMPCLEGMCTSLFSELQTADDIWIKLQKEERTAALNQNKRVLESVEGAADKKAKLGADAFSAVNYNSKVTSPVNLFAALVPSIMAQIIFSWLGRISAHEGTSGAESRTLPGRRRCMSTISWVKMMRPVHHASKIKWSTTRHQCR